jgi:hypothetical protein
MRILTGGDPFKDLIGIVSGHTYQAPFHVQQAYGEEDLLD